MNQNNKAKLVHGLSDFHIAIVEKDDRTGVEYGTVHHIEGAVNVSVTPNTDSNTKYADNGAFAVLNNLSDIDVSLAAVDIPQAIKREVYDQKETNGVIFSNQDDVTKDVALGFRARTQGGGSRFYWLLKGKPEILGIEHQTDEGNIESQDSEMTLKFTPLRYNGNWKAELDSEIVTVDEWFNQVVYDETTAEALTGGTGGVEA